MNLITVKKFPLDKDLTHITGFLRERGIHHKVYEEAGEQIIAVADPRMVGPIAQFIADVEQGRLIIEKEAEVAAQKDSWASQFWAQVKEAPVTASLILLSMLGALLVAVDRDYQLTHWWMFKDVYADFLYPGEPNATSFQLWRYVTPAFLHFSFLHVLFNSLWMWDLGRRVEFLLGRLMLVVFFIATAALSNVAQYIWAESELFGGMSGVVYALVGFVMVSHKLRPHQLTAVPTVVIGSMLFWLVLCMTGAVDYFIGSGVANAAHIGGLVAGCLFALIPFKHKSR